jgi:23S rRNA (guanosine2251-2'-O)-methyltransferase
VAKKPAWIIDKERGRKAAAAETFWLFGCMRCAMRWPTQQAAARGDAQRARPAGRGCGVRPGLSPRSPIRASFPRRSTRAPSTRARRWRCGRWTGAGWRMWRWQRAGRAAPRAARPGVGPAQRGRDPALGRGFRRARGGGPGAPFRPETGALAKTASGRAGTPALPARAQPRQRDRDAEIHGLPRHRPRRGGSGRHRRGGGRRRDRPAALVLGPRGRACAPARGSCAMCWRAFRPRGLSGRSTSPTPRR